MSAAAIAFADRGNIVPSLFWTPGVQTHGNLGSESRETDTDRIERGRKQVIWNELVITFDLIITHIKKDYVAFKLRHLADCINRFQMLFEQRLDLLRDI